MAFPAYPVSRTAFHPFAGLAGDNAGIVQARLTVAVETPAMRATSWMVIGEPAMSPTVVFCGTGRFPACPPAYSGSSKTAFAFRTCNPFQTKCKALHLGVATYNYVLCNALLGPPRCHR